MFITKGIISLFGNKSRSIDINNLPDLDSSEDVHNFLNSVKSEIKSWKFDKDLRTLTDFLIDVSEKYEIEKYISPLWLEILQNNLNSELLQSLLDISLNMSDRSVEIFDVSFRQTAEFLHLAWTVLVDNSSPMTKFTVLKIFINLPINGTLPRFLNEKPDRVNSLLDCMKEPYDYLRNGKLYLECLLLISKIGKDNEDICKLLAFQGIFEILCDIVIEEDDVVAEDCWKLMKTLMGRFNRDYIREIPKVFNTIADCITRNQQDAIIDFLIAACSLSGEEPYKQNQKYFSGLLRSVVACCYPQSFGQNLNALKLLVILLKGKGPGVECLISAENSDLLDLIMSYSCLQENFEINFRVLGYFIDSFPAISENFICRVTCAPGYAPIEGQQPIFNYLLNKSLDDPSENIQFLCRVLEVILFNNEQAKQLAIHLPVNLNSHSLLSRILQLWSSSLVSKPSYLPHLTRLLIIWVHDSLETCQKSSDFIFNLIPTIFKSFSQTSLNESLTVLFLGVICYQTKASEIRNLILSQVEYQDFKNKIEFLAQLPEFKKCSFSSESTFYSGFFSMPLVKVYSSAVQGVIRYFVKGLTESAPKEQKDLAKLFEVHEAFSSMQYLRQGSVRDSNQLEQEIKQLKEILESKEEEIQNLALEVKRVNLTKNQEIRRNINVLVTLQEQADLSEFENQSLRRENSVLKAKIERLSEELQVFAGKRLEKQSELKLIEIKESLIVNINENKALKKLLEKKNEEYEEALEIIGKLKSGIKEEYSNFNQSADFKVETAEVALVKPISNIKSREKPQKLEIFVSPIVKLNEISPSGAGNESYSNKKQSESSAEEFEEDSERSGNNFVGNLFYAQSEEAMTGLFYEKNKEKTEEQKIETLTKQDEDPENFEKTTEKKEFTEISENITQDWFKDPGTHQDAFSFFDNLDSGSKISSFFQ